MAAILMPQPLKETFSHNNIKTKSIQNEIGRESEFKVSVFFFILVSFSEYDRSNYSSESYVT
jgi:hypothetical protein